MKFMLSSILANIPFLLAAAVGISILVLVHEFGHFITAKLLGVWPEEFGVGLPPKIWGKKIGETEYSVNWLPLGGFVRMHGETSETEISKPARAFVNQVAWKKIVIALAGIFMNFVFAMLAFSVVYFFAGIPQKVLVGEVAEHSPADAAGIESGDIILRMNGEKIEESTDFPEQVSILAGQRFEVTVEREVDGTKQELTKTVFLRTKAPEDEGLLGITWGIGELYYPPLYARPFVSLKFGVRKTVSYSEKIAAGMVDIFRQAKGGKVPEGVAGPVGIVGIVTQVAKFGLLPFFELLGVISINLAILNILPIPPLDGSRVVFASGEAIFGKRFVPIVEHYAHIIGMIIILALFVLLTANEIPKLLVAGSLSNFVDTLLQ